MLFILGPLPSLGIKFTAPVPNLLRGIQIPPVKSNCICWNNDGNLVSGTNGKIRILDGTSLQTLRSVDVEGNVLSIAAYHSGYAVLISLTGKVRVELYNSKLKFTTLLNRSASGKCCITTRHSLKPILVMDTNYQLEIYSQKGELKQSANISCWRSHYDGDGTHLKTEHMYICALNSEVLVSIFEQNLVKKISLQGNLYGEEKILWECGNVYRPTSVCSDAAGLIYVVSTHQGGISVLDGSTGKSRFIVTRLIGLSVQNGQLNV